MKRLSGLLLLFCLLAAPGRAEEASLAADVRTLARSVERLAAALEAQARGRDEEFALRRLDMAIGYLDFRSRRIEGLERDVQAARDAKERLEDLFRQWGERERRLEEEARGGLRGAQGEAGQARDVAAFQRRLLEERMGKIDSSIVLIENRIVTLQKELEGVEGFVQKNLEW